MADAADALARQAAERVAAAVAATASAAAHHTSQVQPRLARVLEAFAAERLGSQHFASVSGYGHGDQGRELLDRVFARVLQAEAAAVRLQFVSGTHAIAAAVREALACKATGEPKVILTALCGHGHLDLAAYERYLRGEMQDLELSDEALAAALSTVPEIA